MSFKIRTVLTVIFAVLSLLVTLTIGSIFSQKSFGAVETEIGHSLTGTASQASDKLDRFMAARAGNSTCWAEWLRSKMDSNLMRFRCSWISYKIAFPHSPGLDSWTPREKC